MRLRRWEVRRVYNLRYEVHRKYFTYKSAKKECDKLNNYTSKPFQHKDENWYYVRKYGEI